MSDFTLTTPVAFIIFNRPDTTALVFAEIAKAKPPKLLVVGDGPRASREGEAERVAETRSIIDQVNWPCEVLTNYSETNLGCRKRVSSGIDWVFEHVEEAIILEDDCLPNSTFFRFCQELLEYYRHDDQVAMISGDNFLFNTENIPDSYYFSRYCHIWGWASWRRAWQRYDCNAGSWPAFYNEGGLGKLFPNRAERNYWRAAFDGVHEGRIDTWDYQWVLTSFVYGMVSIMPARNLICNIGFGVNATHTTGPSIFANMTTHPLEFPLRHPAGIQIDVKADEITAGLHFSTPPLWRRVLNKICRGLFV